jgi:CBS domain-containing protein
MVTAREIMHANVHSVSAHDTLTMAAARMRDMHVGSLPVLGAEGGLQGIITDRDIVVRCLADGHDPNRTTAHELVHATPISVDADAIVSEVLDTMEQNEIRRVPVVEDGSVVGIISEADIVTRLDKRDAGAFAAAVYSAPPNN